MRNPEKSHIDSKEPNLMTREFVKMPISGQPVKNNNSLVYSEEMLYEEPLLKNILEHYACGKTL